MSLDKAPLAGQQAAATEAHDETDGTRAGVSTRRVSSAFIFWCSLGALANVPFLGIQELPQLFVGILGLVQAVRAYWTSGGQRITAPGMYMVASGLFIFFPAIYLFFDDPILHGRVDYVAAVNIAYWSQLGLFYFFWQQKDARRNKVRPISDRRVTHWGMFAGGLLVIIGLLLVNSPLAQFGFDDGASFAGIALLAVSSFRREARLTVWAYLLVIAAFLIYMQFVFAGFGRLQIGALGITIAAAAAHRWRGRAVKLALLASFPPVLSYLAASRVAFSGSLNPNQSASVTGLESAIGPFVRFAELIHLDSVNEITHTGVHTFYAAAVALIPRQIWPTKPIGFGAELGDFFRPDLLGRGHSEAALFQGEWVFAFGALIGLGLFIPVLGLMVAWLDKAAFRASRIAGSSRLEVLEMTALLILSASITDLIWGGSFTYVSRVGPRLICLFAVFLVFGWHVTRAQGYERLRRNARKTTL